MLLNCPVGEFWDRLNGAAFWRGEARGETIESGQKGLTNKFANFSQQNVVLRKENLFQIENNLEAALLG